MLVILNELSKSENAPNILAIHLNDYGINFDPIQREDIMDTFQVQPDVANIEHKQGFYEAFMFSLK